MELKWFFVIWGFIFTAFIIAGFYIAFSSVSTQSYKLYESNQAKADERYAANVQRQNIHFNQTAEDFDKIQQILTLKLQDHELLISLNKSLAMLAGGNNGSSSGGGNGNNPIIINNGTPVLLDNVTR